jgi:hypothetical protein
MKKYKVSYRMSADEQSFINYEVVEAKDEHEAFCKARDKGEQRYRLECRCMSMENNYHKDSSVEDITDMDTVAEMENILVLFDLDKI